MEQKFLCEDEFEQIKDFKFWELTEEQKLLIDKLIINEDLKERYKKYGLCKECKQPNTGYYWCQSCNAKRFQQNFKNWTSGNSDVDKLIQESQLNAKNKNEKLEWIEYDSFENIKYITKGGFGTIYDANWKDGYIECWNYKTNQWKKKYFVRVALKSFNNSKEITLEFLNEIRLHLKMNNSDRIIRLYDITKDSKTSGFMMAMKYAEKGNLRQMLNSDFNLMSYWEKFEILGSIASGLNDIHKEGLIHQDFHSGNILNTIGLLNNNTRITDLGLSKPANEKDNKKVYGVLPYVAPEVLRGKKYTQESDIYSFGIIIYEVFNGLPPYHDVAHEEFLAIKICQGLRPRFNIRVPQLIDDIVKQCVNADPSKRPTAESLHEIFNQRHSEDSEIYKQIKEADEFNDFNGKQPSIIKPSVNTEIIYTTHPQAIYTSRLLNFNNLPEPKNVKKYSESIKIDFTKFNINP
ncbi:kinase-like domain-containing protein [Glomus cerebriforme]|uniref:Kinase-like domain-containing protein n=1 Tax=Glomus cerebriforme TaxID=658196 RepID=A0A397SNU2_9GLOM|nr:kinase-like domain-containing protein [Glomus cerebriforme]